MLAASHVEACAHCRERLRVLEAAGGAMLEDLAPEALSSDALARTMAAIDAPQRAADVARTTDGSPAAARPKACDGRGRCSDCVATPWRWIGPGMRWSRVTLPSDPAAKVFLLRIGAGRKLAMHTHAASS